MKKYNVPNTHTWKKVITKMVNLLFIKEELDNIIVLEFIKKTREYFYILFITNINVKKILSNLMVTLIKKVDNIMIKHEIIKNNIKI